MLCSVLYGITFHSILFHSILFHSILFYSVLLLYYLILSFAILYYSIVFYLIISSILVCFSLVYHVISCYSNLQHTVLIYCRILYITFHKAQCSATARRGDDHETPRSSQHLPPFRNLRAGLLGEFSYLCEWNIAHCITCISPSIYYS